MIGRLPDIGPLTPPPPARPAERPGSSVTLGTTLASGVPPYADDEQVLKAVKETNARPGEIVHPGRPRSSTEDPSVTAHTKDQAQGGKFGWRDLDPHVQTTIAHMTAAERLGRYGTTDLQQIQYAILGRPSTVDFGDLDPRVQLEIAHMTAADKIRYFGTTDPGVIQLAIIHRIEAEKEKRMRLPGPERRIPLRWGHSQAEVREETPRPTRVEPEKPPEPEVVNPLTARLEAIRGLHPQAEVLIHRIQEGRPVPETMVESLEFIASQVKAAREEAEADQATKPNEVKADLAARSDGLDNKIPHPAAVVNAEPLEKGQGFLAGLRSLFGGLISNPFRGSLPDSE